MAKFREMGGYVEGDGWLSYREIGGLVQGDEWLSLGSGSSLRSNPDISQKYKMGDISKGVANTLKPVKKIQKVIFYIGIVCTCYFTWAYLAAFFLTYMFVIDG